MSERFFVNSPLQPGLVVIDGPEARHLATVCRLRRGDAVVLFNGDGHQYAAVVSATERHAVTLDVTTVETPQRELPFVLEVAVPMPKGDRAQFLVEKLTELGVTRFVPLHTARSVVHPREGKRDKLERWVIEASKQCGRNILMQVGPLTDWLGYCRHSDLPQRRWIAHSGGQKASAPLEQSIDRMAIAVGPEGGFTPEEVGAALDAGWLPIDLGARTLRVETAAIALTAWAGFVVPPSGGS